jgi:hypothetical protein
MKKTRLALLAACLLIAGLFAGGRSAAAQESTCNESRARGIAQSTLSSCISQASQEFDISFEVACTCPTGGYTVTVIGAPRCPGQQICPLFALLVGTVQLDCDFNVVASTCGAPQG